MGVYAHIHTHFTPSIISSVCRQNENIKVTKIIYVRDCELKCHDLLKNGYIKASLEG